MYVREVGIEVSRMGLRGDWQNTNHHLWKEIRWGAVTINRFLLPCGEVSFMHERIHRLKIEKGEEKSTGVSGARFLVLPFSSCSIYR